MGVIVAPHLLTEYSIFLQRLCIFCGTLRIRLREDNSCQRLLVDRLRFDLFLQKFQQIVIRSLHVIWQLTTIEGGKIEPLEGLEAGERLRMPFLLLLLHLVDLLDNLPTHEIEGIGEHPSCFVLGTCHRIQTDQHLTDGNGDIERARHIWPPGP